MQTFIHREKQYITINGKDYYLVRGFHEGQRYRSEFAFIQVYGKVPLHPEDLPADSWQLIKTKIKADPPWIFTAFNPKYFDYDGIKEGIYKKLFFIGMTEKASLYVALDRIRQIYRLKVSDEALMKFTCKFMKDKPPYYFETVQDQGNSEVPAIQVEFDQWKMDGKRARELFGIKEKGEEE